MLEVAITLLTSVTLIILGVMVIVYNSKSSQNISFALVSIFLALWTTANYLADADHVHSLLWTRLTFFMIILASSSLMYFSYIYPIRKESKKILYLLGFTFIFSSSFVFQSSFIPRIEFIDNVSTVITGPIYWVFIMHFVISIVATLLMFTSSARSSDRATVLRIRPVITGFILMVIFSGLTNLLLPLLTGSNRYAPYGPFGTLFFVGFTYYSIAKHRLLDIRSIVSRAIVYIFSFATIGLFFSFVLNQLIRTFFDRSLSVDELLLSTTLTLIFAVLLEPARRIYDGLTQKYFYRDSYDSQEVLDKLSSELATEIDLKQIVKKSMNLIGDAIRPAHFRFVVFKDGETYIDYVEGIEKKRAVIRAEVDAFDRIFILQDEVSSKYREWMNIYDADALIKLRTNEETVGAVILGPKQSGTAYSEKDIDLLTIIEKELAIAVQNARYFEQIQEFNIKLQKEIADATTELRATNEKLKALDEAKDEFISMASHQLRTPLTSVKGYISMVLEGDAGKVLREQRKLLKEAFSSSQRMVYLISDLLNVSRLRTGKFVIEPSEIYLPDIVMEEIDQLKPIADSRKLKIVYAKPKRYPKVWLDETKMRQVIMNFIDNAIYYTKAGGSITVKLIAKKDSIEYTVTDTGIGIPKNEQHQLFTKFFRAINARKARPDGTGLGLYMAQRVISAQGGSIVFSSQEGKGSTFGFVFQINSIATKQTALDHITVPTAQSETVE